MPGVGGSGPSELCSSHSVSWILGLNKRKMGEVEKEEEKEGGRQERRGVLSSICQPFSDKEFTRRLQWRKTDNYTFSQKQSPSPEAETK